MVQQRHITPTDQRGHNKRESHSRVRASTKISNDDGRAMGCVEAVLIFKKLLSNALPSVSPALFHLSRSTYAYVVRWCRMRPSFSLSFTPSAPDTSHFALRISISLLLVSHIALTLSPQPTSTSKTGSGSSCSLLAARLSAHPSHSFIIASSPQRSSSISLLVLNTQYTIKKDKLT